MTGFLAFVFTLISATTTPHSYLKVIAQDNLGNMVKILEIGNPPRMIVPIDLFQPRGKGRPTRSFSPRRF